MLQTPLLLVLLQYMNNLYNNVIQIIAFIGRSAWTTNFLLWYTEKLSRKMTLKNMFALRITLGDRQVKMKQSVPEDHLYLKEQ